MIQLNGFLNGPAGIIEQLRLLFATSEVRIYPSTVAYPNAPVNTSTELPAGHLLSFTNIVMTNTNDAAAPAFYASAGNTLSAGLATGTAAWFAVIGGTSAVIVSDSLGGPGSSTMAILDNLSVTSGQASTLIKLAVRYLP